MGQGMRLRNALNAGEPVLATGKVADCEKFYTPPPTELSIALTPSEPSDGPDFFEPGSSNASHTDEIIDSDNDELSEDEREALALGPHADLIPSAIAPEAELLEELVSKAASAPESKAFEPLSSSASPAERYWLKLKTGTISLQVIIYHCNNQIYLKLAKQCFGSSCH